MDRSTFTERRRERTNFMKSSSMARRLFGDTVRSGYEINIEVQRAESHRVIPELLSSTLLPNPLSPPPKKRKEKKKKKKRKKKGPGQNIFTTQRKMHLVLFCVIIS